MKKVYSLLVIGTIICGTLVSVHADSGRDDNMRSSMSISGATAGSGQVFKNKGEMMKKVQEQLKQKREELKQKREDEKHGRSGSGRTQTGTVLTTEQLACARTAVAKREASVISATTTLSTAINAAFTTRAASFNTAWTISGSTDRRAAINTAWTTWKNAVKTARDADKTSRKSAWTTFKTEAQVCKVPEAIADAENSSLENSVNNN